MAIVNTMMNLKELRIMEDIVVLTTVILDFHRRKMEDVDQLNVMKDKYFLITGGMTYQQTEFANLMV